MRIGTNMQKALDFGNKYIGWHGYTLYHRPTILAIQKLVRLGLVEVNKFRQFRVVAMPIK